MPPTEYKCQGCGETIDMREMLTAWDTSRIPERAWHFRCLSPGKVARKEQSIEAASLERYNTWQIQQLLQENAVLSQRTIALHRALRDEMRRSGRDEHDIRDLEYDFALLDERTEEDQP